MSDEPLVPEFTLPDWGTEGAPPPPPVEPDPELDDDSIEIEVERPVLVTAGQLPDRWEIQTVHGLITATGKSDKDEPTESVSNATAKAMSALRDAAADLGANAVTDVSITVSGRKSRTVVTVWGTAVSFSR